MADQLARGIFAKFGVGEHPFQAANGMEDNLRLIDDHLGLYTLEPPVAPGTALPGGAADGAGQIYTDGTYSVLNGGVWRAYSARKGVYVQEADGSGAWLNSGSGWVAAAVLDAVSAAVLAGPNASAGIGHVQSGAHAVARTVESKLSESVSLLDHCAGDGTTDDTAQLAFAAAECPVGAWLDGFGRTFKVSGLVTVVAAVFRLRNAKFVTTGDYASQGRFVITSLVTELENLEVDGGRGTYKIGVERWTAFSALFGYTSIRPTLSDFFKVVNLDPTARCSAVGLVFRNMHAESCIEVTTYGTVFFDKHIYLNCSNKTFHVYHSPDDGVTQAGRTIVGTVFSKDCGLLPDDFLVDGVANTFATTTCAPQGAFNFIVSHGDYTIDKAIVWNYASCGVTADRNRSFIAGDIFIFHDSVRGFSNNPSGAFWLEGGGSAKHMAIIDNLFVWVTARDSRDTAMESCLLQLFCSTGSITKIKSATLLTHESTPAVAKLVRGAMSNDAHLTIDSLYCHGITTSPANAVDFGLLPSSVIGHTIKLKSVYLHHGSVNADQPLVLDIEDLTALGTSGSGGDVTVSVSGNPGITGSVRNISLTKSRIAGSFSNGVVVTETLKVKDNPRIGGSINGGIVYVHADLSDNSYVGGNIAVQTGLSTRGSVDIQDNADIVGSTTVISAKKAKVSGNTTRERIELQDVQTFNVNDNTAKTAIAESLIWINPSVAANVLAGVINANNLLVKTGTVGAAYVTIAGGVSGVTDTNNNKLTVDWA